MTGRAWSKMVFREPARRRKDGYKLSLKPGWLPGFSRPGAGATTTFRAYHPSRELHVLLHIAARDLRSGTLTFWGHLRSVRNIHETQGMEVVFQRYVVGLYLHSANEEL
jgi:hypothetical protein